MRVKQLIITASDIHGGNWGDIASNEHCLVLIFAGHEVLKAPAFMSQLSSVLPKGVLVGCSTAGEIAGERTYEDSAVITTIHFSTDSCFATASYTVKKMEDSYAAGQYLGQQLTPTKLKGLLLFGKGVSINGSALVEGVKDIVGATVPIAGGLAGDYGKFVETLTITPSGIDADGVVAIGFYGNNLTFEQGCFGGWRSFGPTRQVTRCEQNILYELDGQPALEIYKKYLGDYANDLPASGLLFPFEMVDSNNATLGIIRTILGIDEQQGALILAGDISPDGFLRLMHASSDNLIDGAEKAALASRPTSTALKSDSLSLLVSCVGRKLVLGDQIDDEVEAVTGILNQQGMVTGFYSNGEISPLNNTLDCKLHNQTMTVTNISE